MSHSQVPICSMFTAVLIKFFRPLDQRAKEIKSKKTIQDPTLKKKVKRRANPLAALAKHQRRSCEVSAASFSKDCIGLVTD